MAEAVSLIPNATPLERALSLTSAARRGLPSHLITDVWSVEDCPDDLLDILANSLSVDIWGSDWASERKRALIARSIDLHRRKGTLSAIRDYIDLAGGELVSAVTPPQAFYAAADADASDPAWRRWLQSLPEIRLNRVQTLPEAIGISVSGGEDDMPPSAFLGDEASGEPTFFIAPDITPLETEFATMVEDGVTIDIGYERGPDRRVGRHGDVVRFFLPALAGSGFFCDDAGSADYYLNGTLARPGTLTVALGPVGEHGTGWNLVAEQTSHVQEVQPELGAYFDERGLGVYAEDYFDAGFVGELDDTTSTYLSLRLMRPGLTLPHSASFCDADRFGLPAYTAELQTLVPERGSPVGLFADAGFVDAGHASGAVDTTLLDGVCAAAAMASALRDAVLLDLNITPPSRSLARSRRISELVLR